MKKLEIKKMELLFGGELGDKGRYVTGLMCGMAATLLFTGIFAPIAAAPGVGCALGAYAMSKN